MQFRSQFLAAASLHALLNQITPHITPRLNIDNLDFLPCWRWTGNKSKPRKRVKKIRRVNNTVGEHWEFLDCQEAERPLIYLKPLGNVDIRRLIFELLDPESGLRNYRLYRLPTCRNADCVNPRHSRQKIIPINPNHDYPVYLERQSPFSAHLIGSYHPHDTNIAATPLPPPESPKNSLKIEMVVSQEVTESVPLPPSTTVKIPADTFGTGFGQLLDKNTFAEDAPLTPCNVKDEWQAFTTQFLTNSESEIQNWISKWGDVVPEGHTINRFSVECVGDAFEELRKQNPDATSFKLSELLAMEKYWFHPRLVMEWYSRLSPETKSTIHLTK